MKTNITMITRNRIRDKGWIDNRSKYCNPGRLAVDNVIIDSWPTEYENLIVAMESRDVLPPLESLKQKLIE